MKKLLLYSIFILLISASVYSQAGTACWREISAGRNFTLAIKADGTLWGWGINSNQLGLGYSGNQNLPIQIGTANDWLHVSAGADHSLAVKTTGTLWSWGSGITGQLGNGLFNSATWNVTQVGTANDWLKVSAGTQFSLAIKTTGTLWSWGLNNTGQLGDGTIVNTNAPNQVGTANNWLKIDAGDQHSLAIDASGFLYAWGNNTSGQLGNGTNTTSLFPIVITSSNNWAEVSAGFDHSLAINTSSILYSWGNNNNGQLGDGTNTATNTPNVVNFTSDGTPSFCIAISAGQTDSLIIKNNNTLLSCGFNTSGQLGLGNNTNTNIFNQVGTSTTWTIISAGDIHSQAMEFSTSLWSTGRGLEGQLGVGLNTPSNVLVLVNCPPTPLSNNDVTLEKRKPTFYPNPTNGIVNINYNIENATTITLRLTNIQGQTIQETTMDKSSGSQTDSVNLSSLSNGMYFVSITNANETYTVKVIKE